MVMSNEEAIKQLESVTIYHQGKCTRVALDMAIEALKKQSRNEYVKCGECKNGLIERQWIKCNYHNIFMRAEDSCSRGIRRINERSND